MPDKPEMDAGIVRELHVLRRRVQRLEALGGSKSSEATRKDGCEDYASFWRNCPAPYQSLDATGHIIDVNPAWCEVVGFEHSAVVGKYFGDLLTDQYAREFAANFEQFKSAGVVRGRQFDLVCADKSVKTVEFDGRIARDAEGRFVQTHCVFRDITERKRSEAARRLSHRILEAGEHCESLRGLLDSAVDAIRDFCQCEAVGIRLPDDGGNLPYESFVGFSESFCESEGSLSIHADQCMCIDVFKGCYDCDQPFFTEGGSFFINGLTHFPASVADEERRQTRNICSEYGYESVALVPIRDNGDVLGLVHAADPSEGKFRAETVEVLETVARELGSVLRRFGAEQSVREIEQREHALLNATTDSAILIDADGRILAINGAGAERLHSTPEELKGSLVDQIVPPEIAARRKEKLMLAMREGEPVSFQDVREGIVFNHTIYPVRNARGAVTGAAIFAQDITALRDSEQQYQGIFDASTDGVFVLDLDGNILEANPAACKLYGYTRDELRELGPKDLIHPDYIPLFHRAIQDVSDNDETCVEGKNIRRDGTVFDVEGLLTTFRYGGRLCLLNTVRDISERKRYEEKLSESERRYRQLVETMPYGIEEVDLDGRTVFLNKAYHRMLGYEPGELLGRYIWDHEPDAEHVAKLKEYLAYIKNEQPEPRPYVSQNRRKDGEVLDVLVDWNYKRNEQGEVVGFISVVTDITERRRTEQALYESEETHRVLIDNLSDVLMRFDREARHLFVSESVKNVVDIEPASFIGKTHRELGFAEDMCSLWEGAIARVFESGQAYETEFSFEGKGGPTLFNWRLVPEKDASGQTVSVLSISRDVTSHRQAEKALEDSLRTSNDIVRTIPAGLFIYQFEPPDRLILISANPEAERLTGISITDWQGREFNEIWPEAERAGITQEYLKVARTGETYTTEEVDYGDQRLAGVFRIRVFCLPNNRIASAFENISDRKRAERALCESEQRYRTLVEAAPVSVLVARDNQYVYANPMATSRLGFERPEQLVGVPIMDTIHPDDHDIIRRRVERLAEGGANSVTEIRIKKRDGSVMWVESSSNPVIWDGKPATMIIGQDITQRKEAEEAYRAVVDHSLQGLLIVQDGRVAFANPTFCRDVGYTLEEVVSMSTEELVGMLLHPEDAALVLERYRRRMEGGAAPSRYEVRSIHKDGSVRWMELSVSLIQYRGRPATQTACIDITERKAATERVAKHRAELSSILRVSPVGIGLVRDRILRRVNDRICEMTGYAREELLDQHARMLYPTQEDCDYVGTEKYRQIRESGSGSVETRWKRKDGTVIDVVLSSTPLDREDLPKGLTFTALDVTDKKRAEAKVRAATELLNDIRADQSLYIHGADPASIFHKLLDTLVRATDSELGFLDEVLEGADGEVYKKSLAISDISWDADSRQLYEKMGQSGFEFRNLNNLAGAPAVSGELVISNEPKQDSRSGGLPPGHPPLESFMGIPMYFGGRIVGVAGVANRQGGYNESIAEFLEPLVATCAGIIDAYRHDQREKEHVEALERSEQRFRRFFDLAPEYCYMVALDGTILDVNKSALEALGYSRSELLGRPLIETLYAPGSQQTARELFRLWKGEGFLPTQELTVLTRSGERRTVLLSANAVRDSEGNLLHSISLQRDITERKEAERRLIENEEKFRAVFEQAPDAIALMDAETGGFVDFNDKTCQILGYSREELLQMTVVDIEAVETPEVAAAHMRAVLEAGADTFETRHRRKDGGILDVLVSTRAISLRGKRLFVSVWTDITAQKRTREQLELQAMVLDQIEDHVAITDMAGKISYVNSAQLEHVGQSLDEVLGQSTKMFGDDPHRGATQEEILEKTKAQGRYRAEVVNYEPDGREVIVDLRTMVVRDKSGVPIALCGIGTDITERKKSEAKLKSIEWLLTKRKTLTESERRDQGYEDLTELNRCRLILDSVGKDVLEDIVVDFLDLLDTSAAVYEANGDYALGMFTSSWCQHLDQGSRRLCGVEDNAEALASGKWHCHESCWTTASKRAISTKGAVDIECHGGIRLYAVPVFAFGKVVGAMNFGYGDPPVDDIERIKQIARRYEVNADKLMDLGRKYESRPPFIIDLAKRRLHAAARLVGAMVERKQVAEQLEAAKNFSENLIETANAMVVVLDKDGNVETFNRFAERLTGYAKKDVIGKGWFDLCVPEWDRSRVKEGFVELMSGRLDSAEYYENPVRTADGEERLIAWHNALLHDDDGAILGTLSFGQDITDRKNNERKLAKYQSQLQALASELTLTEERERDRLAVSLHDEVSQSLSYVNMKLQMTAESVEDSESRDEIAKLSGILSGIMRELRSLTFELHSPILHTLGFETAVADWLRSQIESKYDITTEFEDDGLSKPLDGDIKSLLFRSVRELLNNAVKHGKPEKIRVAISREFHYIRVRVEDDGAGFSPAEESSSQTGFGLFSMHERLHQLGGSLDIDSEPGRGTLATLRAPLLKSQDKRR